jgi:chorismate mutase
MELFMGQDVSADAPFPAIAVRTTDDESRLEFVAAQDIQELDVPSLRSYFLIRFKITGELAVALCQRDGSYVVFPDPAWPCLFV